MSKKINTVFRSLWADQKGVTLVEYAIALSVALVIGGGALSLLGNAVDLKIQEAENTF